MKLRYKETGTETYSKSFNMAALSEVQLPDDSAFISDMEVFLEAKQEWKCLSKAFADKDVITDDYNRYFGEPKTEADRERGYWK